jgi:hypothetical protein
MSCACRKLFPFDSNDLRTLPTATHDNSRHDWELFPLVVCRVSLAVLSDEPADVGAQSINDGLVLARSVDPFNELCAALTQTFVHCDP